MKRFARRTALVALTWLTAASTLVAGLPHFECVCPDGQRKPVCRGVKDAATGCCCGGSCCSSNGQSVEGTVRSKSRGGCCCCCPQGEDTRRDKSGPTRDEPQGHVRQASQPAKGKKADDALRLGRSQCVRMLTHADDVTSTVNKATAKVAASLEPFALPADHPTPGSVPATASPRDSWQLSHAPPPTDLVIILLHLVI